MNDDEIFFLTQFLKELLKCNAYNIIICDDLRDHAAAAAGRGRTSVTCHHLRRRAILHRNTTSDRITSMNPSSLFVIIDHPLSTERQIETVEGRVRLEHLWGRRNYTPQFRSIA